MKRELGRLGLLCVLTFLVYCATNTGFEGPAFLSDEIGYLSKAATLAGWLVALPSGWHGGYSLFLVPAFWVFDEPTHIFQAAVVINAALWSLTFAALWLVLYKLFPNLESRKRVGAVGLCAFYPAYLVSCGYTIATTALSLLFMLSVLGLLLNGWGGLTLHSVCVGLFYWCHPTGLVVAVASILAQLFGARKREFLKMIAGTLLMALVIGVYHYGMKPWLDLTMGTAGKELALPVATGGGRYTAEGVSSAMQGLTFYKHLAVMLMGQISYFLVCTFGIGLYGFLAIFKRFRSETETGLKTTCGYLMLSQAGLLALGVLYLAKLSTEFSAEGLHTWFYGRYQEVVWMPLLAAGILAAWSRKQGLAACSQVLATGALLKWTLSQENTQWELISLNVQGFWPVSLYGGLYPWTWCIIGAVGIGVVVLLPKRLAPLVVVPLLLLNTSFQLEQHSRILADYSRPNDLRAVVQLLYPRGTQVSLDADIEDPPYTEEQVERLAYYSFYLYDYPVRRRDFVKWLQEKDGPFLTFDLEKAGFPGLQAVALETKTGLLMLVPGEKTENIGGPLPSTRGITVDLEGTHGLERGCYTLNASDLAIFSSTGALTSEGLKTNGGSGPLFFGPYLPLRSGRYVLKLKGRFAQTSGAVLDVTSHAGQETHFRTDIADSADQEYRFQLSSDVEKLEVRFFVSPQTDITVKSYSVRPDF